MTKPVWEENWASSWDVDTFDIDDVDEPMAPTIARLPAEKPTQNEERAKLMAAAPDMARVLLAIRADVEAALADDHTDETAQGHLGMIDAALRKAGVR